VQVGPRYSKQQRSHMQERTLDVMKDRLQPCITSTCVKVVSVVISTTIIVT
jgi:hypothetical protein